jgi:hypothetical protein
MNKKYLFLILSLFTSCQALPRISANINLISDYSYEAQKKEPFEEPYVSTYIKQQKILKFLAADHENNIESKTFKTVKALIEDFKPDMMILEGFTDDESSMSGMIRHSLKCEKEDFQKCGENTYAIILGQKNNIKFTPGEPSEFQIQQSLLKLGYTADDLIGFYIVRQIPQWLRQKNLKPQNIDVQIEQEGHWIQKEDFKIKADYSWKHFNDWYEKNLGKKFDLGKITTEDTAPQISKNPTFLNKISREVGLVRERSIVLKIESMLNNNDKVLVIYGGGHLVKERKVLRDMLGDPKDEKLF